MRILCLYFHYASPDCASGARAYSVLRALGKRHEVTVLTGRHYYDNRYSKRFPWAPPGVDVRMVDLPYANRMPAAKRLGAYLGFPLWAAATALRLPRPDVVYGISTPLTTGCAAAAVARWYGVPWVFEVRDLWPDFPIQMGAVPFRWMQRMLRRMERALYQDADHVVTVSPDMSQHVRACGVHDDRVTTLLQGTDLFLLDAADESTSRDLRERYDLGARRVVLYAGTLGRANDIPTILDAARRLEARDDVVFVIIGNGHHGPDVEAAARAHHNIVRVPPQPRHRMMPWFRLAALSLVSFLDRPVLATNAPTKLFDSLAAGTPVLVTHPGWTATLVRTHQCGWVVPPSAPEAMATAIADAIEAPAARREAGERGARLAAASFDRTAQVDRLDRLLQSVAARSAGRPNVSSDARSVPSA